MSDEEEHLSLSANYSDPEEVEFMLRYAQWGSIIVGQVLQLDTCPICSATIIVRSSDAQDIGAHEHHIQYHVTIAAKLREATRRPG